MHSYRRYQIYKKATTAAHGYGAAENHAQETDAQMIIIDALQALANMIIENKEAMENLARINLTLSQSLNQSQGNCWLS